MNTRCHHCGWSFSLSREATETAVAAALAANEKMHVEHCPRCRKVIKIPVTQLRRGLPHGWTPPEPTATEAEPAAAPEPEPVAEAVAEAKPAEEATAKPRKRRSAGAAQAASVNEPEPAEEATARPKKPATNTQPPSGKPAAEPSAAKKTARKQSKPIGGNDDGHAR